MGGTQKQILKDYIKTISEEFDLSPDVPRPATDDEIYFNWLCADPKCKQESYIEIARMIGEVGYIEIPLSLRNEFVNFDLNKDLQATLKIQHKIIHEIAIRNYLYESARPYLNAEVMKHTTKLYNYDFDKGITEIESGFSIAFVEMGEFIREYLQDGRNKTNKFMIEQQEKNSNNKKPLVYAHVSKRVEPTYEPKYETRANQVANNVARTVSSAAQNVSDFFVADKYTYRARYLDEMNKPKPIGRS